MHGRRHLAWLLLVAGASPAAAHSPVPGIEGFYTGFLHPFSTPSQALAMVGLGLLTGGFAVQKARWFLGVFLVATLAGLLLGPRIPNLDPALYAVAVLAGVLSALAPGKLMGLALCCAAMGGYLIGEASLPDAGPLRDRLFTMSGAIVGANLSMLYLYGAIDIVQERYTWPWVAIAFRVLAAWLGAIALVMLALGTVDVSPPAQL